jgi:ABC-type multidrug transport system ATPase subunit
MSVVRTAASAVYVLSTGNVVDHGTRDRVLSDPRGQADLSGRLRGARCLRLMDSALAMGRSGVVHELSLEVPEGSIVALLGRNRAGKTTTLSGIAGLLREQAGTVEVSGSSDHPDGHRQDLPSGLAYVPEGRGVCRG